MILAAALASLLATASHASLDEARAAFSAGDYAAAERLALDAAASADPAPALYLAGLARFRAGRPAEALEALDQAEAGADTPAAWHFNRGACLYELGRHAEAEAAFLEAAADPAWEALALVNAGFAALDLLAPERARALAARARAAAGDGPALPLVLELEAAIAPEPPAAVPARTTWSLSAFLGAGHDDDALRAASGAVERPGMVAEVESAFLDGGAAAEVTIPTGEATALVAAYLLGEHAYLAAEAEDYSVQQHDLVLALRGRAGPWLLEGAVLGQYALAGVANTRGLQASAGLRLAGARQWAGTQVTRAQAAFTWKDGVGQEFASLDGTRLEVAASHEGRLGWLLLSGGYRFQLERIGAVETALPPVPACPQFECTATAVEPLSYQGHTGWLAARLDPWPWLRVDLTAGVEGRWGLDDLYVEVARTGGGAPLATSVRTRTDLRGFGGEVLTFRVAPWLQLSLRHDWLANRTTLGATTAGAPMGARGGAASAWDKQVFSAGVALDW